MVAGDTYLRILALQMLAEGAPTIAIDPAAANLRAIRAYTKAGFRIDSQFVSHEGAGMLMLFHG